MLRIWARTMQDDKITKSMIYESIDNFNPENFRVHIENICHSMDIPTPIVIKSHINNFDEFNHAVFPAKDFIESVEFDKFIIENASLKK